MNFCEISKNQFSYKTPPMAAEKTLRVLFSKQKIEMKCFARFMKIRKLQTRCFLGRAHLNEGERD